MPELGAGAEVDAEVRGGFPLELEAVDEVFWEFEILAEASASVRPEGVLGESPVVVLLPVAQDFWALIDEALGSGFIKDGVDLSAGDAEVSGEPSFEFQVFVIESDDLTGEGISISEIDDLLMAGDVFGLGLSLSKGKFMEFSA
ncbi:hypothetical protein N9051_01045 [Akkermansiaceae bacterium]|nr:hypothetical protein [Akkermansiaceae bacterium]